jgi:hypothetical protein
MDQKTQAEFEFVERCKQMREAFNQKKAERLADENEKINADL